MVERRYYNHRRLSMLAMALCTIAFVVCILFTVAPLSRIPDPVIHLQTPLGSQLAWAGSWLPNDLGLAPNHLASQANSNYVEFLALIALAFVIYGLCALFSRGVGLPRPGVGEMIDIDRPTRVGQAHAPTEEGALSLIWLGTIAAGLIYVFTPAMLSHDILVYASYSRVIATYHANPYFVPLSAFPQDPYNSLNYWSHAIAAYGPAWLAICAFWGLLLGPQPLGYILVFRLFALAAHLLNTWLVGATLRASGQSPRTVTLGTLLYAWNPLVLLESSLGGHNDVFMVTLILAGVLLAIRADRRGQLTHPRGYLLPIIFFTLAALIKFTTLPLVALFVILLLWKTLRPAVAPASPVREALSQRWQPALFTAIAAGITGGIVALALYGPFWIGHSIHDIKNSFTTPPSALYAENSILRAILAWNNAYSLPPHTLGYALVQTFSNHKIWDDISIAVLGIAIIVGAVWLWHAPTIRTFALAAIAALGALLIVTPWFYSWYVTWLVGLVAVCLPLAHSRAGRALLAFTLTFSASAFLTYLFKDGYPPFGLWLGWVCLTTIAPPILAFLLAFVPSRSPHRSITPPIHYVKEREINANAQKSY